MLLKIELCTVSRITLKSLIEENARLDFSDFLSTLLVSFHLISRKFHSTHLLIYLVNKQAGWHFFSNPAHLFRSAYLLGTSAYSRVRNKRRGLFINFVDFFQGLRPY